MSNFTFLEKHWSNLAKLGDLAEKYVYSDPNTSMIKQGILAENMVKYMLAYDGISEPEYDNTHARRISLLRSYDLLPNEINNILYILRKDRNDATHNGADEEAKALSNLELLYKLCVWYMQIYGDFDYEPQKYVTPIKQVISISELEKINRELDEKNRALEQELIRIQKNGKADESRKKKAFNKAFMVDLNEAQTRELIDDQLRKVGWEVDTKTIRYSKGTRPTKGKNLAIAEWPTDSELGNHGIVDYALFIDETMIGVVEAKRKNKDVSSVLDNQCKDYAKNIKLVDREKYVKYQYGEYFVPFLFAANGREYIKECEKLSGIWFRDARDNTNPPRALRGWPSPDGIKKMLEKDIDSANKRLINTGYDVLESKNGLSLRDYQIKAVKAAEKAIIDRQKSILIAMATGTGKTRTVLGMIYRFLSTERFKRILYLVDRTALGEQTGDTFKDVKVKDLQTLANIYNINSIDNTLLSKETRLQIATVQGVVRRLFDENATSKLGVSDFDLIIVDEAHRGYILDKEMTEDEIVFRNQFDFRSKYKAVIDYFDAVKIALTATPALHTIEIFGEPIYKYTYTQAVIDGYLCDCNPPHRIETQKSIEGIHLKKGDTVKIYNSQTNIVENIDYLPEDMDFEVDDFNRKIVNENVTRVILEA